ncbi:MAG: hypothetical protein IKM46_03225 [Clostridia bacterium]|nr:hypothetical protein [Clostridia bacterium]
MTEKMKIDPLSRGFFADESLEIAERVGMALLECAKYIDIDFDRNYLPVVDFTKNIGARFTFDDSISYQHGRFNEFVEKYPEYRETLLTYKKKFELYDDERQNLRTTVGATHGDSGSEWGGSFGGHANPDFGRIINLGTDGIREIIADAEKKDIPDTDWLHRACRLTLDALDILGDRFCSLARTRAEEAEDGEVKAKYLAAAKAFETVPRRPAPDFTAAVHAFWFVFTFDGIDSPGRFDQYMLRAWEADSDEAAKRDMLDRLWEAFHDTRTWNLCVSGSDEEWCDESNELTYEILKIAREKKYETPNLTVRVHRNTPEKLWDAITDTLASGIGMPAIYNDEVVCASLEKLGIPPCDSHDYCMNGCNQIDIMGKSHMGLEDGEVVLAKCVELALHNGYNRIKPQLYTVKTGDLRYAETYEEVERAVIRQMEYLTYIATSSANCAQQVRAQYGPNPLRSCLIEGCIEKGRDYRNGGPLYGHGQILAEGIADAGDSLYAIKKLVFDEKKYTMSQLIDALEANFEGYEELYRDFSTCEKFGNGIPEVDCFTTGLLNRFFKILKRIHTYRGGVYTGGCSPDDRATYYASHIGALPNGKKCGEPMMADSIAAVPGCDVSGPTAQIRSVLGYHHDEAGSGFIFQNKFDKKMFSSEKGRESFKGLVKAYFAAGGQQFTATVVNPEDLLDALEHPERHRDLIVRVGGFSGYFVELGREIQQSVIKRTFKEL